jgi:hypothetical protein
MNTQTKKSRSSSQETNGYLPGYRRPDERITVEDYCSACDPHYRRPLTVEAVSGLGAVLIVVGLSVALGLAVVVILIAESL